MQGDESIVALPSSIQAIIYVQLADLFPDLKINDFDLDLSDLLADIGDDEPGGADVVDLPMTLSDGSEVEGASDHPDPTQRGAVTG